jgi:hypothetical protein
MSERRRSEDASRDDAAQEWARKAVVTVLESLAARAGAGEIRLPAGISATSAQRALLDLIEDQHPPRRENGIERCRRRCAFPRGHLGLHIPG